MKTYPLIIIGFLLCLGAFIFLSILTPTPPDKISDLEKIVMGVVNKTYIANGNCSSYSDYYQEVFNQNLDLDAVKVWGMDIGLDNLHAFVVVGGHGGMCIVDQHQVACIQLK